MTLEDAKLKDQILDILNQNYGIKKYCDITLLESELKSSIYSLTHYGNELEVDGYIKTAGSFDGTSFIILNSGIHFIEHGGYTKEFQQFEKELAKQESDRQDQRKTNRIARRTSIWAVIIAALAIVFSIIALIKK